LRDLPSHPRRKNKCTPRLHPTDEDLSVGIPGGAPNLVLSLLCAADLAAAVAFYGIHARVGGADDGVNNGAIVG
jgi:hypothetical protein